MSERGILQIVVGEAEHDVEVVKAKLTELFGEAKIEVKQLVSSFDSSRIVNNTSNAMRHAYRVLTDEEKATMAKVKDMGLEFYQYLESLGNSRELSLAKTHVEDAVMRAVRHITE